MDKTIEYVIGRAIQLNVEGSLCPAELWNIVAVRLEHENVETALEQLPDEQQQSLVTLFFRSPDSVQLNLPPADIRLRVASWIRSKHD